MQTTGARSRPSEKPTEAGMPQPSTPQRIEEYCRVQVLCRIVRRCPSVAGASSTMAMSEPTARAISQAATRGWITGSAKAACARSARAARRAS